MIRARVARLIIGGPDRMVETMWSPVYRTLGHYGVRGKFLLWCALIWGFLGINAVLPLNSPPPRGLMHYAVPFYALRALGWPLWLSDVSRGLIWLIPALFALVAAKHMNRSNVALGLLFVPALGYALSYIGSFVMWCLFGPEDGNLRGLTTSVLYGGLCILIRLVARVPSQVSQPPLVGPPIVDAPSADTDGPTP